jgi:hypothetical protein
MGKAQTCKNNDHSQAWPSVAADENVCMGESKNKKAPDRWIRGFLK